MPIAFVRERAFDQCLRFMSGYRDGLTGAVLEYAVKKYKNHRRLSPSINLLLLKIPDASRIMTLFAKFIDCLRFFDIAGIMIAVETTRPAK